MKSFVPWFYLVAATGSQMAYAVDGVDAYRQGLYPLAAQTLVNQSGKDPVADYYMGRMRLYGYGQIKNNSIALRYFTQAGEKGVLPAQQLLARYYLLEEKDLEKALYWFKKSADAGDTPSQMYCAAAYMFGLGTKKNPDVARRYYIDAAKSGNAIAQYTLGAYFLDSRDQNQKKLGVIWLTKAAEKDDVNALAKLGELYAFGTVVAQDKEKAIELLLKAVEQHSLAAMITLGELAIKNGQTNIGVEWLTKAANTHDSRAEFLLGRLFSDPKSAVYNPQSGFMWTLQAAQNGSKEAQQALAQLYKEGKGVDANLQLAEQWALKAKDNTQQKNVELPALVEAARWLSNGKADNFAGDNYALGGIYSAWQNSAALKENNYNPAPQMEEVTRTELYRPNFSMISPHEIPINDYFDMIAPTLNASLANNWSFPRYPFDKRIEALKTKDSAKERENKAEYQAILSQLYNRAILGDPGAQFELGQLYQYGIAVAKNPQQAILYYQLAAAQQEVRAEYNLGVLYLEGQTNPVNYRQGLVWMTDAAFKGNVFAQYALANMYDKGFVDASGNSVVQPDMQQALAMYYLASSNGYGPAQYSLAEYLIKQKQGGLSNLAKENRTKLIRRLYQGAVNEGVVEAELPLAFYNAMDTAHPDKQAKAFEVAKKQAQAGNSEAALLLGIMYERGIATHASLDEAIRWYQQATMSPINAFILGTYYSQGIGVNRDLERGKSLLQQASEAGFSYGSLNLAVLKHNRGEEFLSDLDKARQEGNSIAGLLLADYYLEQANDQEKMQQARDIYQYLADKGEKTAQLKLGYLYDTGLAGQTDRVMAAKWYTASAEQGQPIAQYLLGQLYQLGRIGKEPDYAEAKKWYIAAQHAYAKAAVALGFIYDTVDDNYLKALESYKIAVDQNDPAGEYNLALIYEKGKGLPVDYVKARELLDRAAEQGNRSAMTQLADMYFAGLGGRRNERRAFELYQKAAGMGDGEALYQLGLLSETGVATKLNLSEAVNYYTDSAAKGNEKAKLALARMYQYGLGVNQDSERAKQLYNELAANDNAFAQYQLALILLNAANEHKSDEGRRLLQQASVNGSLQARKMLQWLDAHQQERFSFIEPVNFNQNKNVVSEEAAGQAADLMYLNALSEWNRGDDDLSRTILKRLMTQFPQFTPARRAYEQLNPRSMTFSGL